MTEIVYIEAVKENLSIQAKDQSLEERLNRINSVYEQDCNELFERGDSFLIPVLSPRYYSYNSGISKPWEFHGRSLVIPTDKGNLVLKGVGAWDTKEGDINGNRIQSTIEYRAREFCPERQLWGGNIKDACATAQGASLALQAALEEVIESKDDLLNFYKGESAPTLQYVATFRPRQWPLVVLEGKRELITPKYEEIFPGEPFNNHVISAYKIPFFDRVENSLSEKIFKTFGYEVKDGRISRDGKTVPIMKARNDILKQFVTNVATSLKLLHKQLKGTLSVYDSSSSFFDHNVTLNGYIVDLDTFESERVEEKIDAGRMRTSQEFDLHSAINTILNLCGKLSYLDLTERKKFCDFEIRKEELEKLRHEHERKAIETNNQIEYKQFLIEYKKELQAIKEELLSLVDKSGKRERRCDTKLRRGAMELLGRMYTEGRIPNGIIEKEINDHTGWRYSAGLFNTSKVSAYCPTLYKTLHKLARESSEREPECGYLDLTGTELPSLFEIPL